MAIFLQSFCFFNVFLFFSSWSSGLLVNADYTIANTSNDLDWIPAIEDLIRKGNGVDALAIIDPILKNNPNDLDAKVYKARCYGLLGKFDESEYILKSVLKEDKSFVKAIISLGNLCNQKLRWNEAEMYFQDVRNLDKDNYVALSGLAKVWLNRDSDVVKAKEYLALAHQINPKDERVIFDLAMVYFYNDEFESGKEAFDKAGAINPTIDHKLIARVYLFYRKYKWAVERLKKHIDRLKQNVDESQLQVQHDTQAELILAECLDVLGYGQDAIALYQGVIDREPSNALAHGALVHACGLNQEEAMTHLRIALSLDPSIKAASEALESCRQEIAKVKQWREIVNRKASAVTSGSGSGDGVSSPSPSAHRISLGLRRTITAVAGRLARTVLAVLRIDSFCRMTQSAGYPASDPVRWLLSRMCSVVVIASPKPTLTPEEMLQKTIRSREQKWDERANMDMPGVAVLQSPPSHREFMEQYVYENNPVLIKGAQEGWGGGVSGKEAFTTTSLRNSFGDNLVHVSVSQTGRFDGPESGELWGLSKNQDVLVRPPETSMLFNDFLELSVVNRTSSSSSSSSQSVPPLTETFYMEYVALHQYLGEEFSRLVPMPPWVRTTTDTDWRRQTQNSSNSDSDSNMEMDHLLTNVWIGSKPTVSPLHYDDYENLLCQIRGRKELILFPPHDIGKLYYEGRPKGPLSYTYPSQFTREVDDMDPRAVVFGSGVNVDAPDLVRHPLYARTSPVRVVLGPGDVLYLPAYWHHEVQSLPDEGDGNGDDGDHSFLGLNIAVNFWFANVTAPIDDLTLLGVSTSSSAG
eukprot:gene1215-2365_t